MTRLFRFDTVSVSINAKPERVWEFVADLNNWKQFSDFGKNLEKINENEWVTHTSQGDIKVIPKFDKGHLLLDQICIIPSGEEQFIPYRVVPNGEGSELIMTNQQTATVSNKDYAEQLKWVKDELNNIKKIME
ncbi:SRPBCC family protein [Candidatus Saccharibacteria bacterium]|nr:SRPBCC family protein [Candidatus Saccharibacteria bacterium]